MNRHRLVTHVLATTLLLQISLADAQSTAEVEAYSAQLQVQRDRGEIPWLEWRKRVNEANRRIRPSNPLTEEFYAYTEYVAAQVDAGRISKEEGNFLIARKRSETAAALQGDLQQTLDLARQVGAGQCLQARNEMQYWCYGPGSKLPGYAEYKCASAHRRIGAYCR